MPPERVSIRVTTGFFIIYCAAAKVNSGLTWWGKGWG